MKNYNLIILAGGKKKPWLRKYNQSLKACLPISNRPMLDWVINAFHQCGLFKNIIVVGDKKLDNVASMAFVKKRIMPGWHILQNLIHAVLYLKIFVYGLARKHRGYVISFCDAPLLRPDIIQDTLSNFENSDADVVLHYVEKSTLVKAGYPEKDRSYLEIDGKEYTGSNIYYAKRFSVLIKSLLAISKSRKVRKDPQKMLSLLNLEGKNLSQIEEALSKRINAKLKIFISPHPEMGVDVDKPIDYKVACKVIGDKIKNGQIQTVLPEKNVAITSLNPKNSYAGFLKLTAWIIAIAGFGVIGQHLGVKEMYLGSLEWIQEFTVLAPILYLIFYLVLSGIFLPALVLKISAGLLFGLSQGIILVTIGSTISSIIKFLLARHWCRDTVKAKISNNPKLLAIDNLIEKDGWKILLLLRNVPVVSSMFLNYICGLSSMRLRDFIYVSSLGRLPSTILYVYLGCLANNTIDIQNQGIEYMIVKWVLFVIGFLALSLFTFYCRKLLKANSFNVQVNTP